MLEVEVVSLLSNSVEVVQVIQAVGCSCSMLELFAVQVLLLLSL